MATLTTYTITTIDTKANTLTVAFAFDDKTTATECISCGPVGHDEQVQTDTDEEGAPVYETQLVTEPRFTLQDPVLLDTQIRAYAAAYAAGLEDARISTSPDVDALVGRAQDAAPSDMAVAAAAALAGGA